MNSRAELAEINETYKTVQISAIDELMSFCSQKFPEGPILLLLDLFLSMAKKSRCKEMSNANKGSMQLTLHGAILIILSML